MRISVILLLLSMWVQPVYAIVHPDYVELAVTLPRLLTVEMTVCKNKKDAKGIYWDTVGTMNTGVLELYNAGLIDDFCGVISVTVPENIYIFCSEAIDEQCSSLIIDIEGEEYPFFGVYLPRQFK